MKKDQLLETSPFDVDEGALIGRDPRKVTADEYATHFPDGLIGLKAIRAKCLDCALTANEVRKCTVTGCPLWPLRMGSNPKGLKASRAENGK